MTSVFYLLMTTTRFLGLIVKFLLPRLLTYSQRYCCYYYYHLIVMTTVTCVLRNKLPWEQVISPQSMIYYSKRIHSSTCEVGYRIIQLLRWYRYLLRYNGWAGHAPPAKPVHSQHSCQLKHCLATISCYYITQQPQPVTQHWVRAGLMLMLLR